MSPSKPETKRASHRPWVVGALVVAGLWLVFVFMERRFGGLDASSYGGGNLARNGSFESGQRGWKDPMASVGSGVAVDALESHDGDRSLRIHSDERNAKGSFYVDSLHQSYRIARGDFEALHVSGWVRSEGGLAARLLVELSSGSSKYADTYGFVGRASATGNRAGGEWERIELTLPLDADVDTIGLWCTGTADFTRDPFSLRFDDIRVTLTPAR